MNLVLFTHPNFLGSQSHPHFARMLCTAFRDRGHAVELRQPKAIARRWVRTGSLAKWAGYVDQYLLFPWAIRVQTRRDPADTLYVFCDQALGPWIPLLAERPHVVHCHDLLALRSALGEIAENPTSFTGRVYQRFIRRGFRQAKHFISVSRKTREDLHLYGGVHARTSEVVYNGLNHPFRPVARDLAEARLREHGVLLPGCEFLLHVGGGQWYKNSGGVLEMHKQLVRIRAAAGRPVPLLVMVSPMLRRSSEAAVDVDGPDVPAASVKWLQGVPFVVLESLYSLADALLFPSLDEGFGWPIAEAMACGCPVVTTDAPPMSEVGGSCALYVRRPSAGESLTDWAMEAARKVDALLALPAETKAARRAAALEWVRQFDTEKAIDAYLRIYADVLGLTDR